jgi:hypothetical protein
MLISWLNYATGGVGKSKLAWKAIAEMGGLVLDLEDRWRMSGLPYLELKDMEKGDVRGKIMLITPDKMSNLFAMLSRLKIANRAGSPLTPLLVFDGFSQNEIVMASEITAKRSEELRSHSKPALEEGVLDVRGWGIILGAQLKLLGDLLPAQTGAHLYATAKVREMTDPVLGGENTILRPAIRGQFGDAITSPFNLITYMEERVLREKGADARAVRRLYFRTTGNFFVKNDFSHLGDASPFPDYADDADLMDFLGEL